MLQCPVCQNPMAIQYNICSYDCMIADAKAHNGNIICPNGLPVSCIRYDHTMLEHEHADHKDYKFPVTVEYRGPDPGLPDWDDSYKPQSHALVYYDNQTSMAVTIYEYCYYSFELADGHCTKTGSWIDDNWFINESSLKKIKELPIE